MGWVLLKRQMKPVARVSVPNATVAWRAVDGDRNAAIITLTKALIAKAKWVGVRRVVVMLGTGDDVGSVSIAPAPKGEATENMRSAREQKGTVTITLTVPGIISGKRPAEPVQFEVAKGAIILRLPDWAAPERLRAATDKALQAVEQAKKPTVVAHSKLTPQQQQDAEDLAEALAMIRAGDTNHKIMDYFGWDLQKVSGLRVQARRAA